MQNFRVTLLGVGPYPGQRAPKARGNRLMAVSVRFENLLNLQSTAEGCVGFAALRIKTDLDNVYGMVDGGYNLGPGSFLRPGADSNSTIGFEMREGEQPAELWAWRDRAEARPRFTANCWRPQEHDSPELVFDLAPRP